MKQFVAKITSRNSDARVPNSFGFGLLVLFSACAGCSETHNIDFSRIAVADRIVVRDLSGPTDRVIKQIENTQQIASAIEFIEQHQTGWSEPFGGSPVPTLMLDFFKHDQKLGGFGFDRTRVIADPVTFGWWSLPIRAEERDAFLRKLEVAFPNR